MENQSISPVTPTPGSSPTPPESSIVSKKNISIFFIIIPAVLLLIILGFFCYRSYQNLQLKKQVEIVAVSPSPSQEISSKSIILKIPIIEYKTPNNKLSEVVITGYRDETITSGEEFIINPATLGFLYEKSVGEIKLKLIDVKKNSIVVEVLADKIYDGSFFPRNPIEREEISETKCLRAWALVMDVSYKYCFTFSAGEPQPSLSYTITERGTMPPPPKD